MRFRCYWMSVLGVGLLALPVAAQPPAEPGDGGPPPGDPAMKQKLLDAFDTNKDGNIDRAERQAIRRAMMENFGGPAGPGGPGPGGRGPERRRRPDGPPPGGPPAFGEGQGPEGRRGPDGRGPEGRRGRGPDGGAGPPGPPNPERLFRRFDENKDESLSRDEFKKLTDFVREHRPMGPPREWRDGQRFDRRGPDGPPRGEFGGRGPEGRRGWWRHGPPGPPPGPEGPPPPPPADGPPPEGDAPEDAI